MSKKLAEPGPDPAQHQLIKLTAKQLDIYALIDSGAPVSLLSQDTYNQLGDEYKSALTTPAVKLHSVTGQAIEVVGTATVTFSMGDKLSMTHQFQIAKNLQPYKSILGLDFLANPKH